MIVVASDQKLPSACSNLEARVSPKSKGWTCPSGPTRTGGRGGSLPGSGLGMRLREAAGQAIS